MEACLLVSTEASPRALVSVWLKALNCCPRTSRQILLATTQNTTTEKTSTAVSHFKTVKNTSISWPPFSSLLLAFDAEDSVLSTVHRFSIVISWQLNKVQYVVAYLSRHFESYLTLVFYATQTSKHPQRLQQLPCSGSTVSDLRQVYYKWIILISSSFKGPLQLRVLIIGELKSPFGTNKVSTYVFITVTR